MIWLDNVRYAKLWKVFDYADDAKYADASIGTSEKNPDGEWVNSRWPARFIGHAFNKLKKGDFDEGDKLRIVQGKLSNESYQDAEGNWKTALRMLVIEAELESDAETADEKPVSKPATKKTTKTTNKTTTKSEPEEPAQDGDLPW